MSAAAWAYFGAGLVMLAAGADLLVRGASRLARRLGISPMVTGLTVAAFGTGAPELAVSVRSGLAGQAGIAVGTSSAATSSTCSPCWGSPP